MEKIFFELTKAAATNFEVKSTVPVISYHSKARNEH